MDTGEKEYRERRMKSPASLLAAIALLALVVTGVALLLPQAAQGEQVKRFASYEELKGYVQQSLKASQVYGRGSVDLRAGAPVVAESGAGARARAEDYSTTNIQVAGVDEPDMVKSDGKYLYIVSGGRIVILDAFPAGQARIVSQVEVGPPWAGVTELFINGDKLVAFTSSGGYGIFIDRFDPGAGGGGPSFWQPLTRVLVYDLADRGNPRLERNISVDGSYVDARMIGNHVYAVTNMYITPAILVPAVKEEGRPAPGFPEVYYFNGPVYGDQFTTILSLNVKSGEQVSSKVYLTGAADQLYVSTANMYLTHPKRVDYVGLYDRMVKEVIIPALPPAEAAEARGNPEEVSKIMEGYLDGLPVEEARPLQERLEQEYAAIEQEFYQDLDKTVIHRIALSGLSISHEASGEVPGQPLNQFSMDEFGGHFRIATTTSPWFGGWGIGIAARGGVVGGPEVSVGQATTAPGVQQDPSQPATLPEEKVLEQPILPPPQPQEKNNVYVLGLDLTIVGRLENLAPGERIYSARFLGERAYLVTFRRVDPLFVVGLEDPSNPRVLGELKIPGFSDYLHPYDETHIIGIGKHTTEDDGGVWQEGIKLSLFDVSDASSPREISKFIIGERGSDSEALRDHKAFLFSRERNLLVIPILLAEIREEQFPGEVPSWAWGEPVWQGAYVLNLDLEGGFSLRGRVDHLEGGEEYAYFGPSAITRSLTMGDVLYTISQSMVKMNSLGDLEEINRVRLPELEPPLVQIQESPVSPLSNL